MLENLPQDIIPRILKNLETKKIGQLATLCKSLKIAAYRVLYPKEWEDNFDKPVLFYVPVYVFDQIRANELKQWSHIRNQNIGISRFFYTSKKDLIFKDHEGYYSTYLTPNEFIRSPGFFPNPSENNYKSFMGIASNTVCSYIYQKANILMKNGEIDEITNPFYGSVLPTQTIKKVDSEKSNLKTETSAIETINCRCALL